MRHLTLATILLATPAFASSLVYQPVNPTFQPGNQLAGSQLLAVAEIHKKAKQTDTSSSLLTRSTAETIKAGIISRATADLYENILDLADGQSGNSDLGDGASVRYVRVGNTVQITFIDGTGETTITVPVS